jgi:hypothetical protein
MHPGRLVSYYLVVGAIGLSSLSCTSDRYVGSMGRTGNYANRGYGFVAALNHRQLLDRWTFVDPRKTDQFPESIRPLHQSASIDLNGDGTLHHDEVVLQWAPNLRLVNKAVPAVTLDVSIEILGGKNLKTNFPAYVRHIVKKRYKQETNPNEWKSRKLGPDFSALVTQLTASAVGFAAIDQGRFGAEDKAVRRQIVFVSLQGNGIQDVHRADFETFLSAISLNSMSGRQTSREQY